MGKEPRKVSKIEDGYVFSHRDDALGRDIFVKKSDTPPVKRNISVPKSGTNSKNNSNKAILSPKNIVKSPLKTYNPPTKTEDYIYIDPVNNVPISPPKTNLYSEVRTYGNLLPKQTANQNYDTYEFPDESGNFTNNAIKVNFIDGKEVSFDNNGNPIYSGKTLQDYRNKAVQQINETDYSTGVTKNANSGGSGIGASTLGKNLTGSTDVYVPKKYDSFGKEIITPNTGLQPLNSQTIQSNPTGKMVPVDERKITGEFKKGGLVAKLKGKYAVGGVVSQNDNQPKKEKTPEELAREEKIKRNVGSALGGVGTSYYSSQIPESNSDATRSGVMGAVSQAGPIGGVIGGVAGIGDKIGEPVKQKSESLNSDGTLNNESAARRNAIIGGIASPSKALAIRSSYKGGYTDISGKGYTAFLEKQAQDQLKQVEAANLASQQQQGLVNRDNNDFDGTITTPYDLKNSTFDKNKQLVLGDGTIYDPNNPRVYRKGGVVGKMKQMCANGGKIVGKGTGKSDSIDAKVEANSFVVPVENAPIAEEIRKKFLKAPKIKKANLNQDKGEEVKLSNGEHLFTPKEDEKLEAMGIDLDVL